MIVSTALDKGQGAVITKRSGHLCKWSSNHQGTAGKK